MVQVDAAGKNARTVFYLEKHYHDASLVEVEITTGRTHQIRVHAAHSGHPVAGDPKYGNRIFNRTLRRTGLRRMFLHAISLNLILPGTEKAKTICAPLPDDLGIFLEKYSRVNAKEQE
jgi:23S rRNA pseudouridine955/2504/2580 synthase